MCPWTLLGFKSFRPPSASRSRTCFGEGSLPFILARMSSVHSNTLPDSLSASNSSASYPLPMFANALQLPSGCSLASGMVVVQKSGSDELLHKRRCSLIHGVALGRKLVENQTLRVIVLTFDRTSANMPTCVALDSRHLVHEPTPGAARCHSVK